MSGVCVCEGVSVHAQALGRWPEAGQPSGEAPEGLGPVQHGSGDQLGPGTPSQPQASQEPPRGCRAFLSHPLRCTFAHTQRVPTGFCKQLPGTPLCPLTHLSSLLPKRVNPLRRV